MKLKYKRIPIRFIEILPLAVILFLLGLVVYITAAEVSTKHDVILNDNYRGTKILVKHYKAFNKDSVYLAYSKPKTHRLKINEIINSKYIIATVDNTERWKVRTSTRNLKLGQTITVTRKFYPKDITEIENDGIIIIWKEKLDSK